VNADMCIDKQASIRDAMRSINEGKVGLTFVLGENRVLLGVVSDGDIRRALLGGRALEDPVAECMATDMRTVGPHVGRNEVLDLMQSCWLEQIPIVDENQRLVGVHLLHEVLGRVPRPNWAVIMAGGKGTRLAPLTDETPKPMLTVAGRPILERLILHVVSYGIQRVFLSVNFLSEQVKEHFGDGSRHGCQIEYLEETAGEPLGTAGSLSLLPQLPIHPVIVLNGDLVTQVELGQMLDCHEQNDCYATLGIRPYVHQIPFGCVTVRDGEVISFDEKPKSVTSISAGINVLSPDAIADVPRRFFPMTELFEHAFKQRKTLKSFLIEDDWVDVGHVGEYQKANGLGM